VISVEYGWLEALLGVRKELCLECLRRRAGLEPDRMIQELTRVARVFLLHKRSALCTGCRTVRIVWKLR
jgi:hypothetical protein